MDLALDYAVPLPMQVIAGMIGLPESDCPSSSVGVTLFSS
jgi:cytochrome P450